MHGSQDIFGSPAYQALSPVGRRVLHAVKVAVSNGHAAASLTRIGRRLRIDPGSARYGVRQIVLLGFVSVTTTPHRHGYFRLCDGWQIIDEREAARLKALIDAKASRLVP